MDRVSETQADLAALIDRVARGEEIEITRGGLPVARLVAANPSPGVGQISAEAHNVVARFRALREEIAARGVSFTWDELKAVRDEGRP